MKKLPIGIQTIEEIIQEDYIYVDKTDLIFRLINEGKYYFLSRPRRFGKSLLISTLKKIFSGEKELFKNCFIYSLDYEWQTYPIIHLDFTQILTKNPLDLEKSLKRKLIKIAQSYGKSLEISSLQEGLIDLVEKLSEKGRVVVLVDEYDKSLIDNLEQPDIAKANRDLLKDFFGTLKGLDQHLKFILVTGVSKFSQVSLFSGFNNLDDITINSTYATLLGYTEKEIALFFKEYIERIGEKQVKSPQEIIDLMRYWYNGYRFSRKTATVYNPFSTLLFLKNGDVDNYWFQTATPTFLINQIKKQSYPIDQISGIQVDDTVFNSHDIEKISLISLMWQTGYLTIKNYEINHHLYCLDYPNEEVKASFLKYLAEEMTGLSRLQASGFARQCALSLNHNKLEEFFIHLKAFFTEIPYDMHVAKEKYYQTIFYVIAKLIGLDAQLEVKTNIGRIDMVVITPQLVYIFEFKINSSAEEALEQINDKKYFEKYLDKNKKLILIGVNFNTNERNLSDWKTLSY